MLLFQTLHLHPAIPASLKDLLQDGTQFMPLLCVLCPHTDEELLYLLSLVQFVRVKVLFHQFEFVRSV